MKNLYPVLTSLLLFVFTSSFAGEWVGINNSSPQKAVVTFVSNSDNSTVLQMKLSGFYKKQVVTPQGNSFKIYTPGATPILEAGNPDLPKIASSIIIPDLASMKVEVLASTYIDYHNIDIAPSKGSLLRTVDPSTVAYTYSDVYNQNKFYPSQLCALRQPFIVRDFRGQTVLFNPFSYNPVTKTLRVYTDVTVKVSAENNTGGINSFYRTKPLTSIDKEYAQVYKSLFKNGGNYVNYIPMEEDGDMLIISHGAWIGYMFSFVEWKTRRGVHCELVDVAAIGNNDVAIKTYIQNYYAAHNLKYVLIVGDAQYVATPQMSGGASDPSYGFLAGNDSYAEVFVGRFSAESIADVQTQVQRSIDYEANPTPGGTWYKKGTGMASDLGPGDDNEMDWEHERNIRSGLLSYGFTDVDELYDGSHGIADAAGDPVPTDLIDAVNAGRSVINYTGHGSQNSCATTGFSSSNISSLTNYGMLPFWWSVGCVHGFFDNGTCLAEALLRAQDAGQPKGMIAAMMSSINQYWNEPMDAQDEFDSILCESYVNNIKRTYAGISVNGCMHMNDNYGTTGNNMTNTWHCFGDPSIVVRDNTPVALTATHTSTLPVGVGVMPVNCNIDDAVVTFTKGTTIYGMGTVSAGQVILNFNPFLAPDTIQVTATAFNCIPYTGTVLIIPAAGPFIVNQLNTVHDASGNNNGVPDYSEAIDLDVTLQNVGISDAISVTANLTTTDPYVTISNNSASFGNITAGNSSSVSNAFSYTIANNIPDQHAVVFDLTATDNGGNTWASTITQIVNAPLLLNTTLAVNDVTGNNNGYLDPGETADIVITTENTGHSDSPVSSGILTSTNPGVTINSANSSIGIINAGISATSTLNVSLAPNVVLGTTFDLTFDVASAAYSTAKTYLLTAGELLEDFETGNFTKYNWQMGGNQPWVTATTLPFQGVYCARSGVIGDNQTTSMYVDMNVLTDDSISFYKKVSSEIGYDYLRFYIDGDKQGEWSGNVGWSYNSYPVTAGNHTVEWSYEKDQAVVAGSDATWVDNIQFPPFVVSTGINETEASNEIGIYPNPAHNVAYLTFALNKPQKVSVKIFDMEGKPVSTLANNSMLNSGKNELYFNTGKLARGTYTVQLISDEICRSLKLVVMK